RASYKFLDCPRCAPVLLLPRRARGLVRRRPSADPSGLLGHRHCRHDHRSPRPARDRSLMTQILMPALSPTMEEGNLAKWLVKVGDRIEPGKVIAEIETDKATMEVEAVDEGVVSEILVPEGAQGVKVNTPIAVLDGGDGAPAKAPEAPKQQTKA